MQSVLSFIEGFDRITSGMTRSNIRYMGVGNMTFKSEPGSFEIPGENCSLTGETCLVSRTARLIGFVSAIEDGSIKSSLNQGVDGKLKSSGHELFFKGHGKQSL